MAKTTKTNRAESALKLCKEQFEAMLVQGTPRLSMIEMAKEGIKFCEVINEPINAVGEEKEVAEQGASGVIPAEH